MVTLKAVGCTFEALNKSALVDVIFIGYFVESSSYALDKLIQENATVKMDQNVYNSRLDGYNQRYDALNVKLDKLREKEAMLQHEAKLIEQFEKDLLTLEELPVDFSPELWNALIEKVTIRHDGSAEFQFKNGALITETL